MNSPGFEGIRESVMQSKRVWFDDGNVVLQAENVRFRVHRSILSKHSPIFANLFTFPHPVTETTIEGCPVVHLHDAFQDVEHFLLAIYGDPWYTNARECISFSAVAAMIRLGKKYEEHYLRDEGLARLKLESPTKLEDFDKLDFNNPVYIRYQEHTPDPTFATINLAHECKIRSILPCLYLFAIQCDLDKVLLQSDELPIPYGAMRSCVSGRPRLLEAATKDVYHWMQEVGVIQTCATRKDCQNISRRLMKDYLKSIGKSNRYRALRKWDDYAESESGKKYLNSLCEPCRTYARSAHENGRKAVWEALPTFFQLPRWEDLKDFDD